ncbi:hypothetical protein BSKO_10345 [Bryopsis sp. KO-2023]|nr:hypothetical protein BSKO_10345 [Bryopsis sp. KO-2023]
MEKKKAILRILVGPFGANKVWTLGSENSTSPVIFFVGDQLESKGTPPEIYQLQDPKNQVSILAEKFPGSSVMVVVPSRLEAGFACFDHFLDKTTRCGEPLGYVGKTLTASRQMESILSEGGAEFKNRTAGIKVLGFSKGGVVLNQLLAEMGSIRESLGVGNEGIRKDNAKIFEFLSSIREMHYLDVGLHCRGGYLTDPRSLQGLGDFEVSVFLHGTPRQWKDVRRPWVLNEKNMSKALLREEGVPVHEKLYLENESPGLAMHFNILTEFDPGIQD